MVQGGVKCRQKRAKQAAAWTMAEGQGATEKLDVVALKVELERVTQQKKEAEADNEQLKLIEEELVKDRDNAFKQLRDVEREKYQATREAEEWRERAKELEQRCQSAEVSLAEIERRALAFSRKNAALSHEVASLRETTGHRIKELEEQVANAEARGRAAAAAAFAPEHSSLMNSKTTLEHDMIKAQSEATSLKTENSILRKNLEEARAAKQEKEQRILTLEEELAEASTSVQQLESKVSSLTDTADTLKSGKSAADAAAQQLHEQLSSLQSKAAGHENTIKELKQSLSKERSEHRATAAALSSAEGKLSQLAIAIDRAHADSEQSKALAASVLADRENAVQRQVQREQQQWESQQAQEREQAVKEALELAREVHTREINRLRQELALQQEQMEADLETMRRRAAVLVRQVTEQYNSELNEARREGIDAVRQIAEIHAKELDDEAARRDSIMADARVEAFRSTSALREDLLGQVSVYRQAACLLKLQGVAAAARSRALHGAWNRWTRQSAALRWRRAGRLRACAHQVRRHRRIRRLYATFREWRSVTGAARLGLFAEALHLAPNAASMAASMAGSGYERSSSALALPPVGTARGKGWTRQARGAGTALGNGTQGRAKEESRFSTGSASDALESQFIPSSVVAAVNRSPAASPHARNAEQTPRGGVLRFNAAPAGAVRIGFGSVPAGGEEGMQARLEEAWASGYVPPPGLTIMESTIHGRPVVVQRPAPRTLSPMLAIVFAGLAATRRRSLAVSQVFDEAMAQGRRGRGSRNGHVEGDESTLLRVIGNSWGKVAEVQTLLEQMLQEGGSEEEGKAAMRSKLPAQHTHRGVSKLIRDVYNQSRYGQVRAQRSPAPAAGAAASPPARPEANGEAESQVHVMQESGQKEAEAPCPLVIRLLPWDLSSMVHLSPSSAEALLGANEEFSFFGPGMHTEGAGHRRVGQDKVRAARQWSESVWFDSLCSRMGTQCGVVFMEADQVMGTTRFWTIFTRLKLKQTMRAFGKWKSQYHGPSKKTEEEALAFALDSISSLQLEVDGLKTKLSEQRSANWTLKRKLLSVAQPSPFLQDLPANAPHTLPAPPDDGPEREEGSSMEDASFDAYASDGRGHWRTPEPRRPWLPSGHTSAKAFSATAAANDAKSMEAQEEEGGASETEEELPQAPPMPMRQSYSPRLQQEQQGEAAEDGTSLPPPPPQPVKPRAKAPQMGFTGVIPCQS